MMQIFIIGNLGSLGDQVFDNMDKISVSEAQKQLKDPTSWPKG